MPRPFRFLNRFGFGTWLRQARPWPVLVIVAVWLLAVVCINPGGNFPLSDDWAFAGSVKTFIETGSIRLPDWSAPNFIVQMFWGALFCLPGGFSFLALRVSTLVLGLLGILAVYGLFREVGATRSIALFGALSLALNPLYLVLSYTFMTDIPFATFCFLSLYFLTRALRTDASREIVLGLLLALAALLIRQLGIAIFVGASFAYCAKHRFQVRTAVTATVPLLLGVTSQFLFQEWLVLTKRVSPVYQIQVRVLRSILSQMSGRTLVSFVDVSIIFLVYLGLFSAPFLMFLGWPRLKSLFRIRFLTSTTAVFAVLIAVFLRNKRMPLLPDVFYNLGLGRPLLYDTDTLHLQHTPTVGGWFWIPVTVLGAVGAIVLFQAMLVAIVEACHFRPPTIAEGPARILWLVTGVIYIAPMIVLWVDGFVFDRYLILLVPIAALVLFKSSALPQAAKTDSTSMIPALSLLLVCGAFSIAGTHDYLAWNRARWQALSDLMQRQNVLPNQIDGGFEFNSWYLYDRSLPNQLLIYVDQLTHNGGSSAGIGVRPGPTKSWWWVYRDDYVVTLGPVVDFTEVKRYQFPRWLPPGKASILVLRKNDLDSKAKPMK